MSVAATNHGKAEDPGQYLQEHHRTLEGSTKDLFSALDSPSRAARRLMLMSHDFFSSLSETLSQPLSSRRSAVIGRHFDILLKSTRSSRWG